MTEVQVQFQPAGKRITLPAGANLLEAAQAAGIDLSSVCGGEGTCGQCQVVVIEGQVSPLDGEERLFLSRMDLFEGRRLACRTRALGDVIIEVPKDSMVSGQRLQVDSSLRDIPVDPLVRAYPLELPKASLTDSRPDFSRLKDQLRAQYQINVQSVHPSVIRRLPELIRKNDWRVTAFVREDELVGIGSPGQRPIGFCIDLGTTKIAAALVDLQSGEILGSQGAPNPQIAYGEDVISRINYVQRTPEGAAVLADKVQKTLNDLLGALVEKAGVDLQQVVAGVLVGNTPMVHLLLQLPVRQLAASPYISACCTAMDFRAAEIGLEMAPGASLYIPPCVGGFVGSDHIAMILACDLDKSEKTSLGIDIGTNTEIVIRKPGQGFLSSASCASGPAFEGAHITEGMRAASGAIEKVHIEADRLEVVTIQNEAPVGLCGSGIIDTVAELHRLGWINRQGSLRDPDHHLRQGKHGAEFVLVPAEKSGSGRDIVIDQKDVNEVQLAKGAIQAGLQVLLETSQTAPEEVEEVIIAGAFGTFLNIQHALAIGLFPQLPNAHYKQVGNAALVGARWMLISRQARERAQQIQNVTRHQELINYPRFNRIFALAMLFPNLT